MKYLIILCLLLAGCAINEPLPNNPYQVETARLIGIYNIAHHLNLPIPSVQIGPTTELSYANDWCPHATEEGCYITLNSIYIAKQPDYMMNVILRHEIAHHICVLTVPGCMPNDHGKAWKNIATELGMPADSY